MKVLISEKLSPHKYKTPEGYLICVDAVLARTGKQTYKRSEIFNEDDNTEIEVNRLPEEVFSEQTLASFENKPITVEHPDEDVNSTNFKDYSVGFVRDVHKGNIDGQDVILGTLVIQDDETIREIESGEHTELSCGYDCDIIDEENPQQRNIRGNHVALCECGRAGNARIVDSKKVKDIRYKNYDIEYNFYGQKEYTVQYQGDDIWFKTEKEARDFIDEITSYKDSIKDSEKDAIMDYLFSKKYKISQQRATSKSTGDNIIIYTATNDKLGKGLQFSYNTKTDKVEVILYKDTLGMSKRLNSLSEIKSIIDSIKDDATEEEIKEYMKKTGFSYIDAKRALEEDDSEFVEKMRKSQYDNVVPTRESSNDKVIYTLQSNVDSNLYFYIGKQYAVKDGQFTYNKFKLEGTSPEQLKNELVSNGWKLVNRGYITVIDIKDNKPVIEAKGIWEYDDVKEDWYDTGRKMYYEEIKKQHLTDEETPYEEVTENLEKNIKDDSDLSLLKQYFSERQPNKKMELRNKLKSMNYREGVSGVNSRELMWVSLNGKNYEVKNLSTVKPLDITKDSKPSFSKLITLSKIAKEFCKDDRLAPMTYKKLKEMGYSSDRWKNLTQEEANRIVAKNEIKSEKIKSEEESKNLQKKTSKEIKYLTGRNEDGSLYKGKLNLKGGYSKTNVNLNDLKTDSAFKGTLSMYTDDNGNLLPEREALHQEIIDDKFKGKKPLTDNKERTYYFMGGGPATGKSYVRKSSNEELNLPDEDSIISIDVDEIKQKFKEYKPKKPQKVHEESSALGKRISEIAINEGYNILDDGTGDTSVEKMLNKIKKAKAKGMKVKAVYVTTDIENALIRNAKRSRSVNRNLLIQTHKKVSSILPQIAKEFDDLKLYQNDGNGKPFMIATGGNGKSLKAVKGKEKYLEDFLNKVNYKRKYTKRS